MHPSNEFLQSPTVSAALKREVEQARLRRVSSASAERDARAKQAHAETFLTELLGFKSDDPRVATLAAHVEPIVAAGAAALEKFDGHIESLVVAERNYRAAVQASDVAKARHAGGSLNASEALDLARQVEVTGSALRVRDRELADAQRPARVPSVGLPREADVARTSTRELVQVALKHPIDISGAARRDPIDVAVYASNAGVSTAPSTAIFWIATELEILADYRRGLLERFLDPAKKDDPGKNLKDLFDHRWRHFERTQAMPDVARERLRSTVGPSGAIGG